MFLLRTLTVPVCFFRGRSSSFETFLCDPFAPLVCIVGCYLFVPKPSSYAAGTIAMFTTRNDPVQSTVSFPLADGTRFTVFDTYSEGQSKAVIVRGYPLLDHRFPSHP